MRSRFLFILLLMTITGLVFLSSCSKDSSTSPNDDDEIVINENVVVPEEDDEIQIDAVEADQITLTFAGDAPDIQEDDILVGTENGGYLRKVTAVTVDGNTMEIETIQAVLTEAIENGSLDTTLALDFGTNRSLYGLALVQKMDGVTVLENGINISGAELFNGDVYGTHVEITIPTGTITFTPELDLGFDISWGHLEEFHAIARGALDFNFDIRGEFDGTLADFNNEDDPIELASFSHTFIQMVGFVPVVEVVTLAFEAGYSVDIGYSGAVQAGFDSEIGIECGARWNEGVWSGVWDPFYEFNWHPPEWNAEAHVEIRGFVRPTLSIELYAMAGPYLDVEPYARFDAGVEANPPTWQWGLYGGMESTLGFQIHVLDWELADWNTELLDPPYEQVIWQDSGDLIPNTPPEITSLMADPDIVGVNETSQITCTATDEDGHSINYNWSATCGSINGSGSAITFNAPATPGVCTVSCNVDDGNGGTDNESVQVTVNGPPGIVTLLSPGNGQSGLPLDITFSWYETSQATGYDLQYDTNMFFSNPVGFSVVGTSHSVENLSAGTMYYWRVRAVNPYGNGPWPASPFSFTTGTPPESPELVSPSNGSTDQPTTTQLSWSEVDGAEGYIVEVSESDTFSPPFFSGPTDITSIEVSGLSNNTTYYWHVSTYDEFGSSDFSDTWNFTTQTSGGDGTCTDYDGNTYETITLGDQVWMAENLKVTHYNDGTPIPTGFSDSEWSNLDDTETGAYAVYDDDPANADIYGYLYNWYAVDDSRGICPEGFHVPSDEEWMELESYLGMVESELDDTGYRGTDQGSQLAGNSDLWNSGALENDPAFGSSGFLALPGGYRGYYGEYGSMGLGGYFWSSTANDSYSAWNRLLGYYYSEVYRGYLGKRSGFSVRCLGD